MTLTLGLNRAMGFDSRLMDIFRAEIARAGGPFRRGATILIVDARGYTEYMSGTDSA